MNRNLLIGCICSLDNRGRRNLFLSSADGEEIAGKYPGAKELCLKIEAYFSRHPECGFITCFDGSYPKLLSFEENAPFGLFYRGNISQDWEHTVCAVGTRHPLGFVSRESYRFGLEAGLSGLSVVSGLAYGLDQDVMCGCLDARRPFIGVAAAGIAVEDYPSNIGRIRNRILEGGGVVLSPYLPWDAALAGRFRMRNWVMARLCPSTVVLQAPSKSGALETAYFALDAGRDVYVFTMGTENGARTAGSDKLKREGAQLISEAGMLANAPAKVTVSEIPEYQAKRLHGNSLLFRFGDRWYIRGDEN